MTEFEFQSVLDGLGQGVLIFDSANRLVGENQAVRALLGNDLKLIRAEGWPAAAVLFNARQNKTERSADVLRAQALEGTIPLRFNMYRNGEYVPCWASGIKDKDGTLFTMVTIDAPDWSAMTELLDRFIDETRSAIETTVGHVNLIEQTMKRAKPGETVEGLSKRLSGFMKIITTHMNRLERLMNFMARLEDIRTGRLKQLVADRRKRIVLEDFIEDFLEELDREVLIDPETETQDYRSRITASIPSGVAVAASSAHLTDLLRDILRNAIMYSMKATPVTIKVQADETNVTVSVTDEGYGVRPSEYEKVFQPFQRSRQPQVIGEFGYGQSLFLSKHEVEAMNGRIWFESEEGVGTTFSFKLPRWQEGALRPSLVETMEVPGISSRSSES